MGAADPRPRLMDYPDLNRLAVFYTLVNQGTMSRASHHLFITQPAISAHVKALEQRLGVKLFDRAGRGSVVSAAGRVLYDEAEKLFAVADELQAAMEDLRGLDVGRLVLASSHVWQYRLPEVLRSYGRLCPGARVSVQVANSDSVERLVLDRAVDVGLIARGSMRSALVSTPIDTDEAVPFFLPDHPLVSAAGPGPESLDGERLVVREPGSVLRSAADRLLDAAGPRAGISIEVGGQEAAKQAVLAGHGAGVGTRAGLDAELRAGMLALPAGSRLGSPLELHVVHLAERRLSLTQKAFLDLLSSADARSGREVAA